MKLKNVEKFINFLSESSSFVIITSDDSNRFSLSMARLKGTINTFLLKVKKLKSVHWIQRYVNRNRQIKGNNHSQS